MRRVPQKYTFGTKQRRHRSGIMHEVLEPRRLFSTYTVNLLGDPQFVTQGTVTLRVAVNDADAHAGADTINFAPSLFSSAGTKTITLQYGQLSLSDKSGATTIVGPGTSTLDVSGGGKSRVFGIQSGVTASFSGFTITDGAAPLSGGAYQGGGIYNAGVLTLNNVNVTNNVAGSATSNDAANTAVEGGGIYSNSNLTIAHSTLSGNASIGGNIQTNNGYFGEIALGGAICSTGTLSISSSTLTSNKADGGVGGPGSIAGTGGDARGGAVYSSGKTLTISSSTFSGNDASAGSTGLGSAEFGTTARGGNGRGGAIDCTAVTITTSTLTGNHANGGGANGYDDAAGTSYGGAISASGQAIISSSTLTGNGVTSGASLIGQSGPACGGAIFADDGLQLTATTVSGNVATGGLGFYAGVPGGAGYGGGVYIFNGSATLTSSTIAGNSAVGGAGNPGNAGPDEAAGQGGQGNGGGIYSQSSVTLIDSTVANNKATGGAGGNAGDGSPSENGANGGSGGGAGLFVVAPLKVYDSTVTGNIATGGAGGTGYNHSPSPVLLPGQPGVATGGGISTPSAGSVNPTGDTLLDNSIVSANKAGNSFQDIATSVDAASSYNVIGVGGGLTNGVHGNKIGVTNPKLSSLGNNGGPTQTEVPLATSPVIDAGSNSLVKATTDQRQLSRIFNGTVDIGADEYSTTTITGYVFNDINGDGTRQSTDPGLANWQVFVDLKNVGYYVTGDPVATTNSAGNYSLPVTLTPGQTTLIIREVRQTNWRRTDPAGLYPLGFYTLTPKTVSIANIDFGDSATALVTGIVFDDTNANGKQDSGEAGLSGWTIEVDAYVGGVWQNNRYSTTTNSSGIYSIVLAAGTYRIHDVLKSGFHSTVPSTGTLSLTLTAGVTSTAENFGDK